MSIARVNSFAFAGIDAQRVEVQVQIAAGLPNFLIVGHIPTPRSTVKALFFFK